MKKVFRLFNDDISYLRARTQPKIVEALLGYELVQVSCGASHVLAVTNEREVFAWGRGDNGTLFLCFLNTPRLSYFTLWRLSSRYNHWVSVLLFGRAPGAGHPGHPQLSAAGVLTCGV